MENCNLCDRLIQPGEPVLMEQHGEIVNGKFMGVEEATIRHEECEEF